MNVVFHTTTAIGITVLLTNTSWIKTKNSNQRALITGVSAFFAGIFSHGIMDYLPHCYPIHSKTDAIAGLLIILISIRFTNKRYRIITTLSSFGCILPDLIDLGPAILNKQLGLHLPIIDKFFPWHWHQYSGSVYNGDCTVSMINHLLLLLIITIICWRKRDDLSKLIDYTTKKEQAN